LPAQVIVEAQHLGDQSRPQSEGEIRRRLCGRSRSRLRHHVALEGRQPARRVREPRVEQVVQLVARDGALFEVARRAAAWHDDHCLLRKRGDGGAERVQIGDAHELRPAGRDHLSCGGRSNV
jgi:hypothetical protein